MQFDRLIGAGIVPGADGDATQIREVRAAADEPAKISGQGANVVAATTGDAQTALGQPIGAKSLMIEPNGLVEVNSRGGHDYGLAAMGLDVSALAGDPLGAGRVRCLIVPADELRQGIVELACREFGRIARGKYLAEGVAIVGFNAPVDGGFVDFWNGVQVIEEACGGAGEDEEQAVGEGIERAAVTDSGSLVRVRGAGGGDAGLDEGKAGGTDGFVEQLDAGGHCC